MSDNLQFIKSASGVDVASVSVADCFSSTYDVYVVAISKWKYTGTSNAGGMRFLDSSGNVISDSEYVFADLQIRNYASYQDLRPSTFGSSTSTSILCGIDTSNQNGPAISTGFIAYVFNPNDSASYTMTQFQDISAYDATNTLGYKGMGIHKSAEQITGINFFNRGTGNISAKVNVFGVKS